MKRIDALLASIETQAVDPSAETVINGVPYEVSTRGRVPNHLFDNIAEELHDNDEGPRLSEERDDR